MLISCICVTERRPQFIERAIAMFNAQTYAEKELVIVDDFFNPSVKVPSKLRPEVVYLRCPNYTQGKRLDVGMRSGSGDVLAKMDDDDVYGSEYLSAVALAHKDGQVTCLRKCLLATTDGEVRVRYGRYAGGSIVLDRDAFRKIGMISDIKSDVDGDVLRRCSGAGVAFNAQRDYFEQYTYVRHGGNTWNGMQSVLVDGEVRHTTHDEAWKNLPVYDGAQREEVLRWLQ
jgi:glycosyltransferase involved in cell wall biosynthesis